MTDLASLSTVAASSEATGNAPAVESARISRRSSAPRWTVVATTRRARHSRRRSSRAGLWFGLGGFLFLGGVLPPLVVYPLDLSQSTVLFAYALTVYAAARLSLVLASGEAQLMRCAFWTFSYSFLALPLLAQIATREYPLVTAYSFTDQTFVLAELLVAIGFVGFELGSIMARRSRSARGRVSAGITTGPAGSNISSVRALVLGYIGLGFVLLTIERHGIATLFTSRDALTQAFLGAAPEGVKFYLDPSKTAGTVTEMLTQVPIFVGTYLLLYEKWNTRRDPAARSASWWALAPLIIGNVLINNPMGNARFWYGTVLIGFVTIYLPVRTRRWAARVFVLIFVLTSLFSFQQLAAFRRTGETNLSSAPLSQNLVTDPDYGSPEQMFNGIEYVAQNGHRNGQQLVGSVFVWVPHAIWPGKPGDTGQLIGGTAGFKVADPLWTEGQVDFGPTGTFLYLLVTGAAVCALDRRYRRADAGTRVGAAIVPVLASLLVFILRGSLLPALGSTIPVLVCFLICRRALPGGHNRGALRLHRVGAQPRFLGTSRIA